MGFVLENVPKDGTRVLVNWKRFKKKAGDYQSATLISASLYRMLFKLNIADNDKLWNSYFDLNSKFYKNE